MRVRQDKINVILVMTCTNCGQHYCDNYGCRGHKDKLETT
jgi:RNase P subunit RPR2